MRHSPLIHELQARHTGVKGYDPTKIDAEATVVPMRLRAHMGGVFDLWLMIKDLTAVAKAEREGNRFIGGSVSKPSLAGVGVARSNTQVHRCSGSQMRLSPRIPTCDSPVAHNLP